MVNSCVEMLRPAPVDESDWLEFLKWDIKISRKYGRRVKTEIERLASGDKTITVNRKEPSEITDSPTRPSQNIYGIADTENPTGEEVMSEVKRRMEELRTEDTRSWDEIVTDGRRRWEKTENRALKTKKPAQHNTERAL